MEIIGRIVEVMLKSGGSTDFYPFKYSTTITLQILCSSAFLAKGESSGSRNEKLC